MLITSQDHHCFLLKFMSLILPSVFAGAIGLVFLILGAIVIWYCCQFAFKSEKSIYSEYFPQFSSPFQ